MKRWMNEPLLQFLALGAALFAGYGYLNRNREDPPDQIVVSAGRIEQMAATFARMQQRPPTANELKELIDEYVREEILSREAVKLGLDQDDAVIRRRLQQKLEFIATDLATTAEPTEAELAAWLAAHAENFRHEPTFTFCHVYLNPDKHDGRLDADVSALLADLRQASAQADGAALGDSFVLPHAFTDVSRNAVAAQFGNEFAEQLGTLTIGEWAGPVRSGYGVHLVLLTARTEGRMPALDDVRKRVERDLLNERRLEANRRFLDGLLARYAVRIEWPTNAAAVAEQAMAKAP